ncbi:MAG: diguanylate cyclase [Gammaproteobacteria bacterium]|nr:diguanylate cyclase [Gammaproteobacteria bacterium]
MINIKDYENFELLAESDYTAIYRSMRSKDGQTVILKTTVEELPTLSVRASLQHEYHVLQNLSIPGLSKARELITQQDQLILVLDDVADYSLKIFLDGKPLPLKEFFTIALQITDSLAQLHSHNIIHKDINPNNIVIKADTLQVHIIDFGIASKIGQEQQQDIQKNVLEGTLAYLSPEQTGRMNRVIDSRSDLYSLGITFYEMLTGQLPFEANDFVEWAHCHIAKIPPTVDSINPSIPKALAAIISKLLAKTPEERYASAAGLKADLMICAKQWENNQTIAAFPLAQYELLSNLQISQKLYGREKQIEQLLEVFSHIAQGQKELLFVQGYAGIGKTSLIKEIQKPITEQRGYFISGKFDQLKRVTPYTGFIEAFQNLIKQLLMESHEQLEAYRQDFLKALGNNGQVMVDIIPALEAIIGPQQSLAELSPTAAQNRFILTFQAFVKVLAQPNHPLVIFLDDLQWIDSASLKLFSALFSDPELKYFMMIGAYRDNELTQLHPLALEIQELENNKIMTPTVLKILPLHLKDVTHLLADTFHNNSEQLQIKMLSDVLFRKTRGNPFYINIFIKMLLQENKITFSPQNGTWDWDIEKIEEASVTNNVIDLLTGCIVKLSKPTQHLLTLAACIGHVFDLQSLSIITGNSLKTTAQYLWDAVDAQLITPIDDNYRLIEGLDENVSGPKSQLNKIVQYRFIHDRIQQASYQLLTHDEKQKAHLSIGRLLVKDAPLQANDERLFDILNHFNQALLLLTDNEEKEKVLQANIWAGLKAKSATAFDAAKNYFENSLKLMPENPWKTHFNEMAILYRNLTECEYLTANMQEADRYFDTLIEHLQDNLQKADAYMIKMRMLNTSNQHAEAAKFGLDALKLLNINLPYKPSVLHVLKAILLLKLQVGDPSKLKNELKPMTDPKLILGLEIMTVLATIAYSFNHNLLGLINCEATRLSLKHGYTKDSSGFISLYGFILIHIFHQYVQGFNFVELANKISTFYPPVTSAGKELTLGGFINYWRYPLATSLGNLKNAYTYGLEQGDLMAAWQSIGIYTNTLYVMGRPLGEVEESAKTALAFSKKAKVYEYLAVTELIQNSVTYLQHHDANLEFLNFKPGLNKAENASLFAFKVKLLFLLSDYEGAMAAGIENEKYAAFSQGLVTIYEYQFFYALSLAACYENIPKAKQSLYLKKIKKLRDIMRKNTDFYALNFEHYYLLIKAELARILHYELEAQQGYDQAIQAAKENESLHVIAVANECAGRFYLSLNKPKFAKIYLQEAHYAYERWGALTKVKQLEEGYPNYIVKQKNNEISLSTLGRNTTITTNTTASATLDFISIIKANQAISSEIRLDKLLQNLLKIVIENAGAQRGVLLTEKNKKWMIEAEGDIEKQTVYLNPTQFIDEESNLPLSLIQYSQRTLEPIILSTDYHDDLSSHDPYLITAKPKSALMMPVLYQGQLRSLLYLENNSMADAFTPSQVEALQLLTSQAAIALENSHLYFQATHDQLTGLANRNLLYHVFQKSAHQASIHKKKLAIVFLDLDYFKKINDTMGHEVGDDLLRYFAEQMKASIKENDLAVRLGGDEFVLLLEGIENPLQVNTIIKNLYARLQEPVHFKEHTIKISSSMGISMYPKDGNDIHTLLKNADTALYQVKNHGKNYHEFYSPEILEEQESINNIH